MVIYLSHLTLEKHSLPKHGPAILKISVNKLTTRNKEKKNKAKGRSAGANDKLISYNKHIPTNKCYFYSPDTDAWESFDPMSHKRAMASGVMIKTDENKNKESWWILGGMGTSGTFLETTEVYDIELGWNNGPELPKFNKEGSLCTITINETFVMVVGSDRNAFLYNMENWPNSDGWTKVTIQMFGYTTNTI